MAKSTKYITSKKNWSKKSTNVHGNPSIPHRKTQFKHKFPNRQTKNRILQYEREECEENGDRKPNQFPNQRNYSEYQNNPEKGTDSLMHIKKLHRTKRRRRGRWGFWGENERGEKENLGFVAVWMAILFFPLETEISEGEGFCGCVLLAAVSVVWLKGEKGWRRRRRWRWRCRPSVSPVQSRTFCFFFFSFFHFYFIFSFPLGFLWN